MNLALLHQNLLQWYATYGRHSLPWRHLSGENAPYGVYVSEVMLQQTQVKTVLERFYTPFMQQYPTLASLAYADESKVLKSWEGLGYYSRARHLHHSAKLCVKHYEGKLPCDKQKLLGLKGIGDYTAGAILCFGYRQIVSFVDSNIARILCRIYALSSPTQKTLQDLAAQILNPSDAFNHNQALMDLGALICTAKNPSCLLCPLNPICAGKIQPHLYPKPKKNTLKRQILNLALCIDTKGKIAFVQSQEKLYYGLYNLPLLPAHCNDLESYAFVGDFKHHYTIYQLDVRIYRIDTKTLKTYFKPNDITFFDIAMLQDKPLSKLCIKALQKAGLMQ
ncbi:A/G-specific adenine glycosylase [Helicobacter sp. MIT 05-5293]|uniref:A/G-specific adenine glycosylase n=1 Tax=Helicobacter sp. MIT 05-5293 TaxID=1548149 RepID=UPI00051D4287|nr:A/G-specific adenine glycosylase [Helicobacter sp. MIT 05-5293]TLD79772.1 A/G-specific adenine glycosylase [Helicobacter sp. MIT 05-5293]